MSRKKLVVFDIDGTLIDSGGAGMAALNSAMEELTGVSQGFEGIHCAGKTDLQIVREAYEKRGLPLSAEILEEFLERYVAHLVQTVASRKGSLKPGVTELLMRLVEEPDVYLGLLTGNVQKGARLKLEPYSLNDFFPLGAFGDDSEDRNLLLPIAVRRLSRMAGIAVSWKDCVVIGDTPRDVACARVHGSRSIAVATGPYSVEDLARTEADLIVPDMSHGDMIGAWIREMG